MVHIRKGIKKAYRKVTVFEGYFSACWETSYLASKPEHIPESETEDRQRRWFIDYLKNLLKQTHKRTVNTLSLEDLIPEEVFKALLENADSRFLFKVTFQAEPIPTPKQNANHQPKSNNLTKQPHQSKR